MRLRDEQQADDLRALPEEARHEGQRQRHPSGGDRAPVEMLYLQPGVRLLFLTALPSHEALEAQAVLVQALQLCQRQEGQLVRPLRKHPSDQGWL